MNSIDSIRQDSLHILLQEDKSVQNRLQEICELLQNRIPHYNWVGFYWANHGAKTLHLGTYAGEATDHTVIPFGKGICGQVAESNANFIVPDVQLQTNYIACSVTVKAEIVLPVWFQDENVGQIDIDSHQIDPFTNDDVLFLEWLNEQIAHLLSSELLAAWSNAM
ncbi:MAG: histidine kinase [Flavobacterium sp. BFFFF2]|nr:MAG: histidine kinase [Flavobacterium sp. BFFFF2]